MLSLPKYGACLGTVTISSRCNCAALNTVMVRMWIQGNISFATQLGVYIMYRCVLLSPGNFMSQSGYVNKNCNATDLDSACPERWDELKPAFSDIVRHCAHCNKKVYLCETDEQIKFYSSVKFCIAVAQQEVSMKVERVPPPLRRFATPWSLQFDQTMESR